MCAVRSPMPRGSGWQRSIRVGASAALVTPQASGTSTGSFGTRWQRVKAAPRRVCEGEARRPLRSSPPRRASLRGASKRYRGATGRYLGANRRGSHRAGGDLALRGARWPRWPECCSYISSTSATSFRRRGGEGRRRGQRRDGVRGRTKGTGRGRGGQDEGDGARGEGGTERGARVGGTEKGRGRAAPGESRGWGATEAGRVRRR